MTKRKQKRPKYLHNMVSVFIGRFPFLVQVAPATTHEDFVRELSHCKRGVPGECASCANAEAAMDAGIAPYMAFSNSRAVAIDKIVRTKDRKGYYGVGRIWEHTQGKFQKKYDDDKDELLKSEDAVGTVILSPYRTNKPGSGPHPPEPNPNPNPGVRPMRESPRSRKGSLRRAQRAGIFKSGSVPGL